MDSAPSPAPKRRRWWRRRGRSLPERSERQWVHPSEFASFDKIPEYDGTTPRRHRTPIIIIASVSVLTLAALTLALRSSSPPATSALRDHIAQHVSDLPSYAQDAASSAIELVIAEEGHVQPAAALVLAPGDLAVTTVSIPPDASITVSSASTPRFSGTLVTHDAALGFSVVHLSKRQPVTSMGVLPASSSVLAIAPVFSLGSSSPSIAYATTVIGDPVMEQSDGVVSYLATASAPNLRGYADTLAVDGAGDVVAILSANGQWYSAQYVAKVARVVAANGGCHGELGVRAETAQGGGVVVVDVQRGPSYGVLHRGDVLESANGVPLDSLDTLLAWLYASPARTQAHFSLMRSAHPMRATVTLGCRT